MTPPDDIAAIAARMDDDEQYLFRQFREAFSIHPANQTRADRMLLRKAEFELKLLTNPSFDNFFLTPLGFAVRDYLEGKANAD